MSEVARLKASEVWKAKLEEMKIAIRKRTIPREPLETMPRRQEPHANAVVRKRSNYFPPGIFPDSNNTEIKLTASSNSSNNTEISLTDREISNRQALPRKVNGNAERSHLGHSAGPATNQCGERPAQIAGGLFACANVSSATEIAETILEFQGEIVSTVFNAKGAATVYNGSKVANTESLPQK